MTKTQILLLGARIRLTGCLLRLMMDGKPDQPRDKDGKYARVSATGANKFLKHGFMNRNKEKIHEKHLVEFPGFTMKQYIARGMELVQLETGGDILGHKDKDDIITRYNAKTNEFAKGRPDRGLYTFYKPVDGKAYYDFMKEQDLKHGGTE